MRSKFAQLTTEQLTSRSGALPSLPENTPVTEQPPLLEGRAFQRLRTEIEVSALNWFFLKKNLSECLKLKNFPLLMLQELSNSLESHDSALLELHMVRAENSFLRGQVFFYTFLISKYYEQARSIAFYFVPIRI